ncbi:MAG: DNA-binding response regulator [Acidobacteria bacterium RIFCSPLOWO2_02_FULL_59_13]|nr:MAG: DNA-binding response regulator [Acidobacteria bacterium RIFCSPLOWO2_02_FULL_59_13]
MIRVLICDDHAIVRQGLRQIIDEQQDMNTVAEAGGYPEVMKQLREHQADLVLLDISMPGKNGIEILKLVKKEFPKLVVLVLSMYPEDQYAVRAIRAGASGYLTKQSAADQLITAIRQVSAGRKYITPELAQALANTLGRDADAMPHETLSDREYQTLCLIAAGKTLSQIAEELSLSAKTVSVYRARLLEKMGLKNNAELTHYALKNGLVQLDAS